MAEATTLTAEAVIRAVDQFSGPVAGMSRALSGLGGAAQKSGISITKSGRQALGYGAAASMGLMIPISKAVSSFASYEEALLSFRRVFQGSDEEFASFRKQLEAVDVPVYLSEMAAIAEKAATSQVGVLADGRTDLEELLKFTRLAAEFSAAFGVSASDAGEHLATLMGSLGLSADEMRTLSDQMSALDNQTGAAGQNILAFTREMAPMIATFGGGRLAADISAVGSAIIAMGKEPGEAATGLRNLLLVLSGAGTDGQLETVNAILDLPDGLKAVQAFAKDATGTLVGLFEKLASLPEVDRSATLEAIVGKKGVDALMPLLANVEELKRQLALVSEETTYGGATLKEYEVIAGGFSSQIIMLNKELGKLVNTLVETFLPTIKDFVKFFREGLQDDGSFGTMTRSLTVVVGLMVTLGPGILAAVFGFQALIEVVRGLSFSAGAVISFSDVMLSILNGTALKAAAATVAIYGLYKAYQLLSGQDVTTPGEDWRRLGASMAEGYEQMMAGIAAQNPQLAGALNGYKPGGVFSEHGFEGEADPDDAAPRSNPFSRHSFGDPGGAAENSSGVGELVRRAQEQIAQQFEAIDRLATEGIKIAPGAPVPVVVERGAGAADGSRADAMLGADVGGMARAGAGGSRGGMVRAGAGGSRAGGIDNDFQQVLLAQWTSAITAAIQMRQSYSRELEDYNARIRSGEATSAEYDKMNAYLALAQQYDNERLSIEDRMARELGGQSETHVTGQATVEIIPRVEVTVQPSPEFLAQVKQAGAAAARAVVPLRTGKGMSDAGGATGAQ